MTGPAPTPAPTLVTERLVLRPLVVQDAAAVASGAGDPRVAIHLLAVPSPYPIALAARWVEARQAWWRTGRGVTLAIARQATPRELLGTVSLRRFARDRRAELGYWLSAGAWNHGFATEACRALIELGFGPLALARIYANVLAPNQASIGVLAKLGLVAEGVRRSHVLVGADLHDVVLYGLLREEWSRR